MSTTTTASHESIAIVGNDTIMESMRLPDQPVAGDETRACLIQIYPAGDSLGMYDLSEQRTIIGRGSNCHIQLAHHSISRQHATIRIIEGDSWLSDLGSTNGTYVNDVRVERHALRAGDHIRCGNHILKFLSENHVEAQYHETVFRMMITDGLTSAYNRRYLIDVLHRELSRSFRYKRQLALLLFDLDEFKPVNDQYGHLAGDEVLSEFAKRVRGVMRLEEVFARYGGEEFASIICETEPGAVGKIAERIRRAIADEPFCTSAGQIHVTTSIGIGQTCGEKQLSVKEFIQLADTKLYEAKHTGKNRVVF